MTQPWAFYGALSASLLLVWFLSRLEASYTLAPSTPHNGETGPSPDHAKHQRRIYAILAGQLAVIVGMGLWAQNYFWPLSALNRLVLGLVLLLLFVLSLSLGRAAGEQQTEEPASNAISASLILWLTWPIALPVQWLLRMISNEPKATPRRKTLHLGESSDEQDDLITAITNFSETIIREEMVPRTDMVALPISASQEEIRNTIIAAGHSRIPIYDGTVDNVCGLLHVKDLFRAATGPQQALPDDPDSLRAMLRATFFVPEVMKIDELLREFQRRKTHLAIVVDEYGGTSGLITLEDCIEQIVGEIQDEYDVEDTHYRVLPDNRIFADGRLGIWELGELLKLQFPEDESYETLAGFITLQTGTVPKVGDTIDWEGYRFSVRDADDRRVSMVEIRPVSGSD